MDCLVIKTRSAVQNTDLSNLDSSPVKVVYSGSSLSIPTVSEIKSGLISSLDDNALVRVASTAADEKKVHWIAWKRGYNVTIQGWYNEEDNNILSTTKTSNIGDYEVHYLIKDSYIDNTSKIRLRVP